MYTVSSAKSLSKPQNTSIAIGSFQVEVETLVEQTVVRAPSGSTADIVTTTHRRTNGTDPVSRPVIFAFNGGPGAASAFTDFGFLGPLRIDLPDPVHPSMHPPFALVENGDSPLDEADVVLIDPPGTGLSRISTGGNAEDFFGVRQDAEAVLATIIGWCARHGRENSPRYLLGESYGVMRAIAILTISVGGPTEGGTLTGFGFNGAMLFGTSAHTARQLVGDLTYILDMPSMAATAWYHGAIDRGSVELATHVHAALEFARTELPILLHRGARLSTTVLEKAATEMSALTGLPADFIVQRQLRVDLSAFAESLLAPNNRRVGMYDSRYTSALHLSRKDPVADDPAMGRYSNVFAHAARSRFRELGLEQVNDYRLVDFTNLNSHWDWGSGPGILTLPDFTSDLGVVMERDQSLRLMFATGYFDLATPLGAAEYVAEHATADPERTRVEHYASGHMPYLGDEPRQKLAQDVRSFVTPTS